MDEHSAPTISDWEFLRKREMWLRYVVNRPELGEWARIVGVHLALRMSEHRPYAWPSQVQIGKDVGCDRNTAGRAILRLREAGLLSATNEKLGDDAGKDSRSYTYTLRLPHE